MSLSTDVPDGASQRHSRMMELLTFVNLTEPRGVTITQMQAHMLTLFGLKFRTTSEMVQELTVSGCLKCDGHGFYHLTGKQQAVFQKTFEDEKRRPVDAVLKRIEKIPDAKARVRAMKLHKKLLDLLPEQEKPSDQQRGV